ncbi:transposase [Actinophytocola oryzae]
MTTIMDPVAAPAKELAALYHERWDIEGFLKQIKSVRLNKEKIFRSKSPDGVRQEFWAHLAVHYATMCVQVDAADQAKLVPIGSHTRTPSVSCDPACGYRTFFPLAHNDDHYRVLLAEVGSVLNPERRDRSYPRVVKRKTSNFPLKRAQRRQRRRARPTQPSPSLHPARPDLAADRPTPPKRPALHLERVFPVPHPPHCQRRAGHAIFLAGVIPGGSASALTSSILTNTTRRTWRSRLRPHLIPARASPCRPPHA